jgi:hypothetical protein
VAECQDRALYERRVLDCCATEPSEESGGSVENEYSRRLCEGGGRTCELGAQGSKLDS